MLDRSCDPIAACDWRATSAALLCLGVADYRLRRADSCRVQSRLMRMNANSRPRRGLHAQVLLALSFFALSISAQVLPPPSAKLAPARIFVREYRFEGNVAFSQTELAKVTAPFTNRAISSQGLEDARRAVTLHYIHH